jgi:hypothetical protein
MRGAVNFIIIHLLEDNLCRVVSSVTDESTCGVFDHTCLVLRAVDDAVWFDVDSFLKDNKQ